MAGSDRSKVRDNPWDPLARKGRWRVWNSRRGKPSWPAVTSRINRPDIWMQAIRSDPEKTLVARGPSTYGSRRSPGRRRRDADAMLKFYDREFASRLLVGSALYPSPAIMQAAIRASGAAIVTVSLRREAAGGKTGDAFWS